jgi:nitrous oxide reductase accessory protein NosL
MTWNVNFPKIEFNPDYPTFGVVWETRDTADRPENPVEGQRVFDSDLGQPIWFDGDDWVDAQGSTV